MKPFVVASPCSASWDAMRSVAGAARHCAACDKAVFDLERMTESEIRGVVALTDGQFCGRQTIERGALRVKPTPVAPRGTFSWRVVTGGAIVATALSAAACEAPANAAPGGPPIAVAGADPAPTPNPSPKPTPVPVPTTIDLAPVEVMAGGISAPRPSAEGQVLFAAKKLALTPAAKRVLDDIAAALTANPWIAKVAVVAHTASDEGLADAQDRLARARAKAVADYLAKKGVAPARVHVSAPNAGSPPDRARDAAANAALRNGERRVDIRICADDGCL